jgi:hypothetical protein
MRPGKGNVDIVYMSCWPNQSQTIKIAGVWFQRISKLIVPSAGQGWRGIPGVVDEEDELWYVPTDFANLYETRTFCHKLPSRDHVIWSSECQGSKSAHWEKTEGYPGWHRQKWMMTFSINVTSLVVLSKSEERYIGAKKVAPLDILQ